MNILIVEDDAEAQAKSARWLKSLGHQAMVASSIPEMLDLLNGGGIDRILLAIDPQRPSVLWQQMKSQDIRVPLLVSSSDENLRDLLTLAARSHAVALPRPFHMEDLAQAIDTSTSIEARSTAAAAPAAGQQTNGAGTTTHASSPSVHAAPAGPATTVTARAPAQGVPAALTRVSRPPAPAPAAPAAASRLAQAAAGLRPEASAPRGSTPAPAPAASGGAAGAGGIRPAITRMLEDLKHGRLKLPALDPRIGKIQTLMNLKYVDVKELVDIIGRDATLTASVLRLANSSFYMLRTPVKDIKDACVRLGNKNVFTIAFEVLLRNQFAAPRQPFKSMMSEIWQNSLVTSRFAARLANMVRYPSPDELQASAFLHNIGELMLIQLFADMEDQREKTAADLGPEIARLHQPLGAALARSWNLPPQLARLIAHHHQPAEDPEPDDQRLPRTLVLASWNLAIDCGFPYLDNKEAVELDELLAYLGINPASLIAMREEARNWVKE